MQDIQPEADSGSNVFDDNRITQTAYLDDNGNDILFSAGDVQNSGLEKIDQQLEDLEYYDHTLFEAEDDPGLDPTLSNVAAALLSALGKSKYVSSEFTYIDCVAATRFRRRRRYGTRRKRRL